MWSYLLESVWEDGQRTVMSAGPPSSVSPSHTVATATDSAVNSDIIYQWGKLPQTRVNVTAVWTDGRTDKHLEDFYDFYELK